MPNAARIADDQHTQLLEDHRGERHLVAEALDPVEHRALRGRGCGTRAADQLLGAVGTGTDARMSRPSVRERKAALREPRTLLPAGSSGGENVPSAPLPGDTVTMPPPMPLLPGRPTSYSQSPDVSYIPATSIVVSVARQVARSTTRSPVRGCTPPSARVAPIMARSSAVTATQLCRV